MKYFILPTILIWILTSVLKSPVFISLTASYGLVIVMQSSRFAIGRNFKIQKIIAGLLISTILLAYLSTYEIYPPNISVLISAGIGFCFIESNYLRSLKNNIFNIYYGAVSQEKVPTYIFLTCLLIIFLSGSFLSIQVGLSWDESVEQQTFLIALDAISNGLQGDSKYYLINNWSDRYYGIGFYFPFYLIHRPFASLISNWIGVSINDAILLSRHIAVFFLFVFSSLFVAGIVRLVAKSQKYAYLISVTYLIWPYALGHGMTNVKDSPFASVWIICSYFIVKIISDYLNGNKIRHSTMFALACSVGWLLSIRISGILIVVPMAVGAIFLMIDVFINNCRLTNNAKNAFLITFRSIRYQISNALPYSALIIGFILIAYPVTWQDPSEFFKAIQFMSRHPWSGCTLTNGECMSSQNLPYSYILKWLMVKEPIVVICGLIAAPFVFIKLNSKKDYQTLVLLFILITPLLIIYLILVLKQAVLYDEIRQILFMAELVFIIGAIAIFLISTRVGFVAISFSLILFTIDNFKIFPHQLSWFNEVSRFGTINNKYVTDYWGNVLAPLAKQVNEDPNFSKNIKCIYGSPNHLFKPFLDKQKFSCNDSLNLANIKNIERPFLYVRTVRDRSVLPDACSYIYKESITLTLASESIYLGEIILCE